MTEEQIPGTPNIQFICRHCQQEQHVFRFKNHYHLHDDTCGYTVMFVENDLAQPEKLEMIASEIRAKNREWTCPHCKETYTLEEVPVPQGMGRLRLSDPKCELVLMCEHDSPDHEIQEEADMH